MGSNLSIFCLFFSFLFFSLSSFPLFLPFFSLFPSLFLFFLFPPDVSLLCPSPPTVWVGREWEWYTLYTLQNKRGQVVAVVIEAKLSKHSEISHAVAQAIRYHIKLASSVLKLPLVLVVTEKYVKFAFFPFEDAEGNVLVPLHVLQA